MDITRGKVILKYVRFRKWSELFVDHQEKGLVLLINFQYLFHFSRFELEKQKHEEERRLEEAKYVLMITCVLDISTFDPTRLECSAIIS